VFSLRHVTYEVLRPWIPEDELKQKPLGERIQYVRENLKGKNGQPMTQPEFAKAVGLKGESHHSVMHWESENHEPKRPHAETISALAGNHYASDLFRRSPDYRRRRDRRLGEAEAAIAKLTAAVEALTDRVTRLDGLVLGRDAQESTDG